MKKNLKILIGIMVALALVVGLYNRKTVMLWAVSFFSNTFFLLVAIILVVAVPVAYMFGKALDVKFGRGIFKFILGDGSKEYKILDEKEREKRALEFINDHWETIDYLEGREKLKLIDKEQTTPRPDSVPFEYYLFGIIKHDPSNRPGVPNDTLPPQKRFYVFENCATGECSTIRPETDAVAAQKLDKIFRDSIKKTEEFEILQKIGGATVEGLGIGLGQKMAEKSETSGSKQEKEGKK